MTRFYALAVLIAFCSLRSASSQTSGAASTHLQALLDSAVARGVPGVSAAIATRHGVIWTGTAGTANVQTGSPMRSDMLFGIGSITKTFVTVVILQLAQEGRLNLNATAARILGPAVRDIPNGDKATILELLNHTGGVPSWEDDSTWIREGRGDRLDVGRIWPKTATLDYVRGHAPLGPPGKNFSYSNTDFTILGMIIEKVTGQDALAAIRTRILEPLGLRDIYMEGFQSVPLNRLPHRYHWATPTFRRVAGINPAFREVREDLIDVSASNLSVEWTAGGLLATAQDLALYGVALRVGRLVDQRSMSLMTQWTPAGDMGEVGHNLFRRPFPDGHAIIGHGGDVLGFTAALYWLEGSDVVMVVVANVGSMHAGDVPATAKSVGRDRAFVDWAARLASSSIGTRRRP